MRLAKVRLATYNQTPKPSIQSILVRKEDTESFRERIGLSQY